jgi:hypothetical protein
MGSSVETAARRGASRLPPQLQRRLGLRGADDRARRRQRRRVAATAASTVAAGLAAAETTRRGRDVRQVSAEIARLTHDVRELGGAGVGAAGTVAGGMLLARRLRRRPRVIRPDVSVEHAAPPTA